MSLYKYELIIITPVYEDLESFSELIKNLKLSLKEKFFIIAIDDGSILYPLNLKIFDNLKVDGKILKLNENLGHQVAIAIGLNYVKDIINEKQFVVVIDSDGEDDPKSISKLKNFYNDGNFEVVVAERKQRQENKLFIFFYLIYKLLFRLAVGQKLNFGNFMIFKKKLLNKIIKIKDLYEHFPATVLSLNTKIGYCKINRSSRYFGKSKMNFIALVQHAFRSFNIFIEIVLARIIVFCIILALFIFLIIGIVIMLKFLDIATPGWFSTAIGILAIMLIQVVGFSLMSLLLTRVIKSRDSDKYESKNLFKILKK